MKLRRNRGKKQTMNVRTKCQYDFKPNSKIVAGFIPHPENRAINPSWVRSLRKDLMADEDAWKYFPAIEVNIPTKHVLEGHHRLAAFKSLPDNWKAKVKIPVIFDDYPPEKEIEIILARNNKQRPWKQSDWREHNKNLPEVAALIDFCSSRPWCMKKNVPNTEYGAAFFWGKALGNRLRTGDFSGEWAIHHVNISKAASLYNVAAQIAYGFQQGNGTWFSRLGQALYAIDKDPLLSSFLWNDTKKFVQAVLDNPPQDKKSTNKNYWYAYIESILLMNDSTATSVPEDAV